MSGHGEKLRLGICVRAGVSVERLDSWSQRFQSRVSELHVSGPVMRSIMAVRKYDRGGYSEGESLGARSIFQECVPNNPLSPDWPHSPVSTVKALSGPFYIWN